MENKLFEERIKEIEAILAQLGGEQVPLEESVALYQKGMKTIEACQSQIDTIEKELEIIEGEK